MKGGHILTLWAVWSAVWLGADFGARSVIGWGVVSAASGLYLLWFGRRRGIIHKEGTRGGETHQWPEREKAWIQALQHFRHHWLNECQLIRGYTQLRRWERVDEVICRMASAAERQAMVTDLEHPNRSGAFLRFLCEFPRANLTWEGPPGVDLPAGAISQVEGELRQVAGAWGDDSPLSGGSPDGEEWRIFVRFRPDGLEVRLCDSEGREQSADRSRGREGPKYQEECFEPVDGKGLYHVD